ncbi:MAG: alpha/beta hydrolase [Candidatus Sumerlaeota bacterium]|nr:alpha/beta hydrolase [Candidatus Sumerlaeota bacterium]
MALRHAAFDMAAYLSQLSAQGKQRGYKEVVYKQTPQGELRIYFAMPADWSPNDKRPALVFFYGGGWSGGDVFSDGWVAEHFTKCGVVVGLVDYRVRNRQGVMLDKCAEDARSAVRWVRANCQDLGVDPECIIAGGGSAGGHIAGCTAVIDAPNADTDDLRVSCIPNGLILFYPVASLVDGSRAKAFQQMLGADLALKLSPARNVTRSWPPTVLFSGTSDRNLANGILLHNNAKEAGVMVELYVEEGAGHGVLPTGPMDVSWLQYAADFFIRAGVIDKGTQNETPSGTLKKYNGEPVETIQTTPNADSTRMKVKRHAGKTKPTRPAPASENTGKP